MSPIHPSCITVIMGNGGTGRGLVYLTSLLYQTAVRDDLECILLGLFWPFLFLFRNNRMHGISISKRTLLHVSDLDRSFHSNFFNRKPAATCAGGRVGFPPKKFPKRTRILSILSKPNSFHSVQSAIGSRMNGMIFCSFRKRNSCQKNTNTVYSEYSYSGIVPKERALSN